MNKKSAQKRLARVGVVLSLLLSASMALVGCSSATEASAVKGCSAFPGVIFVVSVHANTAAPDLTPELACQLQSTIQAGKPVGVVTIDGSPKVLVPPTVLDIHANNPNALASKVQGDEAAVIEAIQGAKPKSNGDDLTDALLVAANSASTSTPKVGELVVLDSGLPDSGSLKMTDPGMTAANPVDVVNYLKQTGVLQSDSFSGLKVQLVGFGYVSAPQKTLAPAQATRVIQIFNAVLRAGGAQVQDVPYPRQAAGPKTKYTVKTVKVEVQDPLKPMNGTSYSFGDDSALRFQPNKAVFVDSDAAKAALISLGKWLAPGSGHHATVIGRTASGNAAWNQQLSDMRAAAVKSLLVELGADPAAITPVAAGYTANPPDLTASGQLDPAAAALNRVVVISLG